MLGSGLLLLAAVAVAALLRPGAAYDVQGERSERNRLNQYNRLCSMFHHVCVSSHLWRSTLVVGHPTPPQHTQATWAGSGHWCWLTAWR